MMNKEEEWLLSEKYNGKKTDEFERDLERLLKGEPIDYVIGFSKFLGTHIDLSMRPLIPRVETEYWVGQAIEDIKNEYGTDAEFRFLDIFSGSGCIGIALLKHFPNAKVDFAEIEPQFLEQIQKNLEINNIENSRCQVYNSDVWSGVPDGARYNAIFANPPYIGKEKQYTDASVVEHEPHGALFAENNGLALIEKTIDGARGHLKEDGGMYIEHDIDQVKDITEILKKNTILKFSFCNDQYGRPRYLQIEV